ncbi:CHAD domain-containing protein [Thiomonas sp. FB-6]|uniref:CYTH and CHAD domain-containing protein n=1 Tax=Thiomonas sp. FB-6 TaxID=1158291 RepID=UPI00036BAC18|nr:CHAD domain-containing protein [Thiomonas sp. FB-6]
MGVERELKFSVSEDTARAVEGHALLLLAGAPRRELLQSWYFDTPELDLGAAGMVLRVRDAAGGSVVTVKARGADALGAERSEWEWRALDSSAAGGLGPRDLRHALRATALGGAADGLGLDARELRRHLEPRFGTRFERDTWQLEWNGARIELALDRGVCQARRGDGMADTALCELELEVLDGTLEPAWDLAWTLAQDLALRLSPVDKARRAAALLAGERPRALPEPGALARGATLRQAAQDWLLTACAQLAVWSERIGSADEERDVHQFRVVLRRLRTALRWLAPQLGAQAARWLRAELRWAHQLAGLVRDADVALHLLRQVESIEVDAAAQAAVLAQRIETQRTQHRAALCAYLGSARFGRLLLALGRCSACTAQREPARRGGPHAEAERGRGALRRLAARALRDDSRAWRAAARACAGALRAAADGQPPQGEAAARLHALRIASKRLRLSAERMAGLLQHGSRQRQQHAGKLAASLQTQLGDWHDAERLLQEAAQAGTPMPALRAWLEARALEALRTAAGGLAAGSGRMASRVA